MPGPEEFHQQPNSPHNTDKTISAKSLNSFKARLDSTTASKPNLGALS